MQPARRRCSEKGCPNFVAAGPNQWYCDNHKAERDKKANKDAKKEIDSQTLTVKIKNAWEQQVDGVVNQVLELRKKDANANAGENQVGNTGGGKGNPLELKLPAEAKDAKITHGDILKKMHGYDSSFSTELKFKRSGVLVHVKLV